MIPDGITEIGMSAFEESGLESVVIPDSVTNLAEDAFFRCTRLKNVKLSKNMREIATASFCQCKALVEVKIPEGIEVIGRYAFRGCTSLNRVVIPQASGKSARKHFRLLFSDQPEIADGLMVIDKCAFARCTSLPHVILPDSVKVIESGAFENCSSLTPVKHASDADVKKSAFGGCDNSRRRKKLRKNKTSSAGNAFENSLSALESPKFHYFQPPVLPTNGSKNE